MSKPIVYTICLIILLALNIIFPKINSSAPNFLFLLTVIYSFQQEGNDFLWLAFFSGLLLDIFSSTFFGTYTISFLVIAMMINYTTSTFLVADPAVGYIAAVIFVANLFLVGLIYIINSIGLKLDSSTIPLPSVYLQAKVWADVIWNLIFALPVLYISHLNQRIIEHYQKNSQRL